MSVSRRKRKQDYRSKAYREFLAWLLFKHGNAAALLIVDQMHRILQQPGFMRRLLAPEGTIWPEPKHTEAYCAYMADYRPYNSNLLYKVPEGWRLEKEIPQTWTSSFNY